jgi:hypothetical protein
MPSTVIRRFDYSPERCELLVEFLNGRRYLYRDVPEAEAVAMRQSFARGVFFNSRIRSRYASQEVGRDAQEGTG